MSRVRSLSRVCAGDCSFASFLFATGCTIASAFVMITIKPFTSNVECGDGRMCDLLELILADARTATEAGAAPGGVRS